MNAGLTALEVVAWLYAMVSASVLFTGAGKFLWHRVTNAKRWLLLVGMAVASPFLLIFECAAMFTDAYLMEPEEED